MKSKAPEREMKPNEHLQVLDVAKERLHVHLSGKNIHDARDALDTINTALAHRNNEMAYQKILSLLNMLMEITKKESIPLIAPSEKDFKKFINHESLDEETEFLVILHSLFYLSLTYYPEKQK